MVVDGALDRARASAETRAILLFASAQFLDVATTLMGLRSGRFREANPVAAGLINLSGDLLLTLKLAVTMTLLLLAHRYIRPPRRAGALLLMTTVAMVAPLLNTAHLVAGH